MVNRIWPRLAALIALVVASPAFSGDPTMPRVDTCQQDEQRRIVGGVVSGDVTKEEAGALEKEQGVIERAQQKAEADGTVTKKERAKINRAQNKASRDIYRAKHNENVRTPDAVNSGIDARQQTQQKKIMGGVVSGEVTRKEAAVLEKEQGAIERAEQKAEADGTVTKRERARINNKQNRASSDIGRARRNGPRR